MTKKQTAREKNEMVFNLIDLTTLNGLRGGVNQGSPRIPEGENKEDWIDLKCFYPADNKSGQAEFFITLNLKKSIGKISHKDISYAEILTQAFCKTMRGGLSEKECNELLEWEKENPEEAVKQRALQTIDRIKETMKKKIIK